MQWITEQTNWKAQAVPATVVEDAVTWAQAKLAEEEDEDAMEEGEAAGDA